MLGIAQTGQTQKQTAYPQPPLRLPVYAVAMLSEMNKAIQYILVLSISGMSYISILFQYVSEVSIHVCGGGGIGSTSCNLTYV